MLGKLDIPIVIPRSAKMLTFIRTYADHKLRIQITEHGTRLGPLDLSKFEDRVILRFSKKIRLGRLFWSLIRGDYRYVVDLIEDSFNNTVEEYISEFASAVIKGQPTKED